MTNNFVSIRSIWDEEKQHRANESVGYLDEVPASSEDEDEEEDDDEAADGPVSPRKPKVEEEVD